jgi:hypothetical protein
MESAGVGEFSDAVLLKAQTPSFRASLASSPPMGDGWLRNVDGSGAPRDRAADRDAMTGLERADHRAVHVAVALEHAAA